MFFLFGKTFDDDDFLIDLLDRTWDSLDLLQKPDSLSILDDVDLQHFYSSHLKTPKMSEDVLRQYIVTLKSQVQNIRDEEQRREAELLQRKQAEFDSLEERGLTLVERIGESLNKPYAPGMDLNSDCFFKATNGLRYFRDDFIYILRTAFCLPIAQLLRGHTTAFG